MLLKLGINKRKIIIFILCLFTVLKLNNLYTYNVFAEDNKEYNKQVLFISSYNENFLSVPEQINGLKSVFLPLNITMDIEYMDTKRFDTIQYTSYFYNMIKYKLDHLQTYDAVIVGDDNALQFVMDHLKSLFEDVPIVFLGINNLSRAELAAEKDYITGIFEETSIKDNIQLGLKINPQAKKVTAIVDNTLTGLGNKEQFYSYVDDFRQLTFNDINISKYNTGEIGSVLDRVDRDTILLYFSMYEDKSGAYLSIPEAIKILNDHVKVPILRSEVGGVGLGILGGRMISYEETGKMAANMILKVFDGTPIKTIDMIKESPKYYTFDYDIMKKYKIDEKLLPKDSIIINKELSFFEQNNELVLKVLAFIILLLGIVTILIVDNIKRRRIEKELQESHEELTQTFEELAASEEELRIQYDKIERFANSDYLTNLPNRMSFMNKLQEELDTGNSGTILFMDLDNFKAVNDTLGHSFGDKIIQEVAKLLTNIISKNMFISRFGGDEFLIHISGEFKKKSIEAMVHKILKQFETELVIDNIEYFVSFSIGITSYPIDSNEITQLLMYADTAMYQAKHTGKNKYMFFCNNMMVELQNKKQIEIILRNALKTNGFTVVYQPQIEVSSGEIIGFEALLRLKDADISPLKFIPVAEETGLIIDIGRWVTGEVINQLVDWKNKSFHLKPIAINYSSKQLADMEYVSYITDLLKENEIDPTYIEIEITESILLENSEETYNFLGKLKELGVRIALDDFGTGYSSLNYLTYIPVDKIKLDKALCEKFLRLDNIKVINSLISLAHSLDLVITAEGIELMEQYERLKLGGCDYIQGYLFSKPLNNSDIEKIYNCNMLHRIE